MKGSKRFLKVFLILFLPFSALIVLAIVPSNHSLTSKGFISSCDTFVKIDSDYETKGSINYTAIYSTELSMLQYFISGIDENNSVSVNTPEIMSQTEINKSNQIYTISAFEAAIVCSYKKAMEYNDSVKLEYEFDGIDVLYRLSNDTPLLAGDRIIKVGDKDLSSDKDLYNYFYSFTKTETITYIRDSVTYTSEFSHSMALLTGIVPRYTIDSVNTYPSYKYVNSMDVSGPSLGLMTSLSIFNHLTEYDYTKGLRIAGTGTINAFGKAGRIGGIAQKIRTAYDSKVDIYFVDSGDYEDALVTYNTLKKKERMTLVSVSSLYEAISYLENV